MKSFGRQTRCIMGDVKLRTGSFGTDWHKGEFTVFNHWFTADITTVFEKKFYCFDPLHGRLAMWLPSKNT